MNATASLTISPSRSLLPPILSTVAGLSPGSGLGASRDRHRQRWEERRNRRQVYLAKFQESRHRRHEWQSDRRARHQARWHDWRDRRRAG